MWKAGLLVCFLHVVEFHRVNCEPAVSRRMATAARRSRPFYEVKFSDAEESLLKERQGETLDMLAQKLGGRRVHEVQRRCVELGLRCGAGASTPPKGSEKWRVLSSRQ
jgi:hypothetical protein